MDLETEIALFGINVKEYALVDCPSCDRTDGFLNLPTDERNAFLHGSSKLLPMMLDVAANVHGAYKKHGWLKTASKLLSGAELGRHARFCRCAACRSIVLVCPHCSKLLDGKAHQTSDSVYTVRCPHCSGDMDL